MTLTANKVFQFLRGAVRGSYGKEDFRSLKFLVIGTSEIGQQMLNFLCLPDVDLRFQDTSLTNYGRSFSVCSNVQFYSGDERDVIVDFINNTLSVRGKHFSLGAINEDPYTQGIHEFYL